MRGSAQEGQSNKGITERRVNWLEVEKNTRRPLTNKVVNLRCYFIHKHTPIVTIIQSTARWLYQRAAAAPWNNEWLDLRILWTGERRNGWRLSSLCRVWWLTLFVSSCRIELRGIIRWHGWSRVWLGLRHSRGEVSEWNRRIEGAREYSQ